MAFFEILILAVALAADAFAVAVASGIRLGKPTAAQVGRMAFAFGLFQFLMPIAGWFLGLMVRGFIEQWAHWVAFGLLAFIGVNMLREGLSGEDDENTGKNDDPTQGLTLLVLGVATSIDALAVGLSFAVLHVNVWFPALIIGVVCAGITTLGMFLGKTLARAEAVGKRATSAGGLVLLAIGVKTLYDHGVFG